MASTDRCKKRRRVIRMYYRSPSLMTALLYILIWRHYIHNNQFLKTTTMYKKGGLWNSLNHRKAKGASKSPMWSLPWRYSAKTRFIQEGGFCALFTSKADFGLASKYSTFWTILTQKWLFFAFPYRPKLDSSRQGDVVSHCLWAGRMLGGRVYGSNRAWWEASAPGQRPQLSFRDFRPLFHLSFRRSMRRWNFDGMPLSFFRWAIGGLFFWG